MPNPALDAYLAKHYLDGPKAEAYLARSGETDTGKRKRKKVKQDAAGGGITDGGVRVVDDEDEEWKREKLNASDDDESAAFVVDDKRKKKEKRGRWNKVGKMADDDDDTEDADLPQVTDEAGRSLDQSDQQRAEEVLHGATESLPTVRAGLKTREEMRAERLERERREAEEKAAQNTDQQQSTAEDRRRRREREREERQKETVYRDASGRRIDVEKEEAEEQRRRKEDEQREREKREWTKGEKQRQDARRAREREEEERHTSFARSASDVRMNETLRNVVRADDPAARFLTRKNDESSNKSAPRKPTYNGPCPPNRFGIRPGYRWDGVERSNGFEAKLFQRRNERARFKAEKQAWGQEDM